MEKLKIKWSRLALRQTEEIALWYSQKMGQKAMLKFINRIDDTVEILSCSPRIGILDERRSKGERKYYSFFVTSSLSCDISFYREYIICCCFARNTDETMIL